MIIFEPSNDYYKYWVYKTIFGNMQFERQVELKLLSYDEFRIFKDKDALIDMCRKMVYN